MMTDTEKVVFVEAPGATLETIEISSINNVPAPVSKARQTSLIELGQVKHVRLRPLPGGRFEIVDGRRRIANAKAAGIAGIKAIVEELTDNQANMYSLTQMSRSPNPMMEAKNLAKEISKGKTQEQVAKKLGCTQAVISQRLGLLDLIPELQDRLEIGDITITAARLAKKLPPEQQAELAKEKVTVNDAKEALRDYQANEVNLSGINIPDLDNPPVEVAVSLEDAGRLVNGDEVEIEVNGQTVVIKLENKNETH